jgi:hypothetical protein
METLEDCIEHLVGIQSRETDKFDIDSSDYNLLTSLARQTFKGTAYTDRQAELAKQKLLQYKDQFDANGYNIDDSYSNLRMPLRSIDRSRWVKVFDEEHLISDEEGPWIGVRFIFQKKLITAIERMNKFLGEGLYDKVEKIHYFKFNENTCYEIINTFNENNNFEVEDQLLEYYEKLLEMKKNQDKYIPGIYSFKLKNLHEKSFNFAISSIGEPNIDNLCNYYDKKDQFGLEHFDQEELQQSLKSLTPLAQKVVNRSQASIFVNNKEHTVNNLAEVVLELYRFPLVIVLHEDTCYDHLTQFNKAFQNIIPSERMSVMFRLDNTPEGKPFNEYIKQHNLNNVVDKDTKIVYISSNKIPKPLLKSEWFPSAAITTFAGKAYGDAKTSTYIGELDLIIHYDNQLSPFMRKIETI